jgi:hypothetical protein
MMHIKYDCPNCGAKKAANRSSYYPNIVVHKCDGKTLMEVGQFENNQVLPLQVKPTDSGKKQIRTRNFILEKIDKVTDLMLYGSQLNNGCSVRQDAQKYLDQGQIWIVREQNRSDASYMVLIDKRTIPGKPFFSGRDISPIPRIHGEEILRALLQEKLIMQNPFPDSYTV